MGDGVAATTWDGGDATVSELEWLFIVSSAMVVLDSADGEPLRFLKIDSRKRGMISDSEA